MFAIQATSRRAQQPEHFIHRYGVQARRVGGASDYGIDLLGIWRIPELREKQRSQPLRVILQCKAGSQRAGPALIRELEGSFAGAPVGWRGSKVLAFLVSERTATKGVRESLGRSQWPMGFISCTKDGAVQQMLWNRRAEEEGLEGIGVGMRYTGGESNDPEVVLTCNGRHLPLVESTE
ncbi:hypothetical protein VDGE_09017 [Verticillium dahliae]|uniref:Restriction endonuclease type IV Mrr domain-containing protein n=1 Tax=Verticillium dahliae TaxID=27337 RepID=A0A444S5M3_VERDA|nr:hypothetical protein VDGE_09017 [Verticillium dahliae]